MTICAEASTGSMLLCGWDAWLPLPRTVMRKCATCAMQVEIFGLLSTGGSEPHSKIPVAR